MRMLLGDEAAAEWKRLELPFSGPIKKTNKKVLDAFSKKYGK